MGFQGDFVTVSIYTAFIVWANSTKDKAIKVFPVKS